MAEAGVGGAGLSVDEGVTTEATTSTLREALDRLVARLRTESAAKSAFRALRCFFAAFADRRASLADFFASRYAAFAAFADFFAASAFF